LDLTTEQQKEVDKLQVAFQKDILELRLQLEEKQLELKRLLLKDSPVQGNRGSGGWNGNCLG